MEEDDVDAHVSDAPAAAEIEDAEPAHGVATEVEEVPEPIRVTAERDAAAPPVSAETEELVRAPSVASPTRPVSAETADRTDRIRATATEDRKSVV